MTARRSRRPKLPLKRAPGMAFLSPREYRRTRFGNARVNHISYHRTDIGGGMDGPTIRPVRTGEIAAALTKDGMHGPCIGLENLHHDMIVLEDMISRTYQTLRYLLETSPYCSDNRD